MDLAEAVALFGAAYRARQADDVAASRELMDRARAELGFAGTSLLLRLLHAGRIPHPDAPYWPAFLAELAYDPLEPRYVSLPPEVGRWVASPPQPASPPAPEPAPQLPTHEEFMARLDAMIAEGKAMEAARRKLGGDPR